MVELFLDEQPIDCTDLEGETLEQLLRSVQERHCETGRMVVAVSCDGGLVDSDSMGAALARQPSAYGVVEVATAKRERLVVEALTQAVASLDGTQAQVEAIAGVLSEGKEKEGADALAGCIGIWQQVHMAIEQSVRMLDLDPATLAVGGEPMIGLLAQPTEVLVQIKDALLSQDYVLLADVLQYEFSGACDQWHTLIEKLLAEAQRLEEAAS